MKNDIPPKLRELLTHEAYLTKGTEALSEALETLEKERDALIKPAKKMFPWVRPSASAREQAVILEREMSHLRKGLQRAEKMAPALIKELLRSLETYLREQDPEYRKGLATQALVIDWERGIWLLRERLLELRKHIGLTRNAMSACYDREQKKFSDSALQSLQKTIRLANALEVEIEDLNRLRNEYALSLEETEWTDASLLPEVGLPDLSIRLADIAAASIAEAQQFFPAILRDCDQFSQHAFERWETGLNEARKTFSECRESYLEQHWQALREFAHNHWVDAGHLLQGLQAAEQAMLGFEGILSETAGKS